MSLTNILKRVLAVVAVMNNFLDPIHVKRDSREASRTFVHTVRSPERKIANQKMSVTEPVNKRTARVSIADVFFLVYLNTLLCLRHGVDRKDFCTFRVQRHSCLSTEARLVLLGSR